MGIPSEDTFSWYEKGSLIRKAYQLYGKSKDFFLAHGMADTNVHLQNSMVLAKELVKYNVTFQQQVMLDIWRKIHHLYKQEFLIHPPKLVRYNRRILFSVLSERRTQSWRSQVTSVQYGFKVPPSVL